MNTTMQKMTSAVVLFVTMLTAQTVLAYYDPSTGRFLSRDPIGEPGFQVLQRAQGTSPVGPMPVAQQSSRWINRDADFDSEEAGGASPRLAAALAEPNIYAFVLNDPENRVDSLGLISFKNCDAKHQSDIKNAWNGMCAMVNDPKYQCCVNRSSLFQLLKRRCSWGNMKFTCKQGDANSPCGHSLGSLGIGRGSVVLYENAYDVSKCGHLKCTLVHEMTHILAGTPFEGGIVGKADSCCEQY